MGFVRGPILKIGVRGALYRVTTSVLTQKAMETGNRFKGGGWAVDSVRSEEGVFPPHCIRTLFSLLRPRDRLLRMYNLILAERAKSDWH